MSWITVDYMGNMGQLPCDIYDANDNVITSKVVGFDPNTGKVESLYVNEYGDTVVDMDKGEFYRVIDFYPAPLTYRKIDETTLARRKNGDWS